MKAASRKHSSQVKIAASSGGVVKRKFDISAVAGIRMTFCLKQVPTTLTIFMQLVC